MSKTEYTDEQFAEMSEDAFVNIKEACMRLQERTKCSNDVVIRMLNEVAKFYILQDDKKNNI
tara:strand:- start:1919 stop:2104 length:186 start_codon:yes stop_codon:yes gene_type:complete